MAQPMLNVGGNLPPEILQQQQALNRQQQMAQLLMQQGQAVPSGQMVSGRYVAPSFFQYASPLLQSYAGMKLAEKGDKAQADLAKALRQQYANEVQQYQTLLRGQEATPEKYTEMAGPFGEGVGPNNRDIPMPVAYQQAQAAVAPNPQAANLFGSTAYNPVLQRFATEEMFKKPKWVKAEYTDEKTGKTRQGVYDENSPDPISTFQVGGVKPEMTAYERSNLRLRQAELADKGIGVNLNIGGQQSNMPQGGTMPVVQGGMPQGGGQTGQTGQTTLPVASADAKFTPATLPKYEYDPSMSPADNRAAQVEFNKKLRTNISNAKDSFGILGSAADVLSSNRPSSGFISNLATTAGEAFGYGGESSQADATLKILGERLTAQVPRFEGPQSDKDTASYRTAAGDLGNANKPIATRIAAVKTMIELNKKYYPNGDWDSIDIAGPVNRRYNPYLPTVAQDIGRAVTGEKSSYSPQEFRKTLNPQDQAAFDFVRRNPNHKDTPAIKKVLGIE